MAETIKILLIDDDEFIRILIKDIFWVHGKGKFEVYEAKNIEEGKKILEEKKPDLIFLDLMFKENGLKTISSFNFLEEIKSNPKTKEIKVIVFSGFSDLKKRALELGADAFLLKGEYLPKELFQIAQEIIEKEKRQ